MTQMIDLSRPAVRRTALAGALLCAAVIAWGSLTPSHALPRFTWSDKIQHFIAYAGLAVPITVALGRSRWMAALIAAIGYGALMELGQGTLPIGRSADIWDGVANTLGAVCGVLFTLGFMQAVSRS